MQVTYIHCSGSPNAKMDDYCWQLNKDHPACAKYLLDNEIHTDVEFRVGDAGELIRAHKLILMMRSPVFDRMFYGPVPQSNPVVIPDIEPDAFRALLRYCYSGCIEVKQPIALGTLDAARKYMLPLLEEGCRETAIKNLGPLTIWETYSCSVCQGDEVLLSHCRDYFRKSVTAVEEALDHSSMLQIPNGVLLDFLQINDFDSEEDDRTSRTGIAISGMELFLACQSWAEAECGRQKIEPSGMNKRMVLGDCLFLIPFPVMFPSDIVNFVSPTDILTQEEKYNLLELSLMKPANSADLPAPKFLAPEQRFLLVLEQEIYARARSEISPFRQSTLQYNTVRFIPKKKVILSGIWIIPPENPPYSSMHEVLIKGNGQIIGNKSIAAEVVGKRGQRPKLLHLPLKPLLLSEQCRYSISVQQNGQQSLLDNRNPEAIALYKTLCYKVKAASHVKMEVVKQQTNECIAAFTARLI